MTYKQIYETENAIACQIATYRKYVKILRSNINDSTYEINNILTRIETLESCQKFFKKLLENT